MEIHRTESEGFLTNAYLVDDGAGHGVLIDGNGVGAPLLEIASARGLTLLALLLTHDHVDHVMLDDYRNLGLPVYAHPETAARLEGITVEHLLSDDEVLTLGALRIECLFTPGHAAGHMAFLIDDGDVITADVLFAGTVGGTRGPGATGIADLRASLRRLSALPDATRVHPGHREPTTIGAEKAQNVFLTALLGAERPTGEPCRVGGEPATLLLWGPDYDGTHKAWVRMADGTEHITGGSQVQR
ncbi:MBL fold metallo-hydrolase [Conexibacter sp. DBS9H8]|uniref:MBL fold metallo-hydrolase n=1 Tax=Conexibacter sp. DBS9H8 TaxID=2937801 RepID=UPI00200F4DFE|nr:MBL fold metallo-hydrolase [Conexibacter sp. DBS9H8]